MHFIGEKVVPRENEFVPLRIPLLQGGNILSESIPLPLPLSQNMTMKTGRFVNLILYRTYLDKPVCLSSPIRVIAIS